MTCQSVQLNLTAFLHGELSPDETRAIHRHLAECDACLQEELDLQQTLQYAQRYTPAMLPVDFNSRVTGQIDAVDSLLSRWAHGRRIVVAIAATIAIILGIEIIGYQLYHTSTPHYKLSSFPVAKAVFSREQPSVNQPASIKEKYIERRQAIRAKTP